MGFLNHPRKNLIKEIEWIGKNGFGFIDLFLEEDLATPKKINIQKVKETIKKYNLEIPDYKEINRENAIKKIIKIFNNNLPEFLERHFSSEKEK